jgi:uncharacterized Ntn-hydrolase superfamily protein
VTWSIVALDADTGAFGAVVATRFLAAAGLCLAVESGVGAVATQATINPTYGPRGLRLLREGRAPDEALAELIAPDGGRDHRQVQLVGVGGRTAAHTGPACHDWSGHRAGQGVGVAGNLLAGPEVVRATLAAYESAATQPFADRLLAAMRAGQQAGGDARGQQSAGLVIYGTEDYPDLALRVDDHPAPLEELRRLYDLWLVEFAAARKYMATRSDPTGGYDDAVIEAEVQRRIADPRARVFPV